MMQKRNYCFTVLFSMGFLLSACVGDKSGSHEIQIGPYVFDFPACYYLEPRQGTDSYIGVITNDTIELHFDYGFYSNSLPIPFDEFYEKGWWKHDLWTAFMKPGIEYDSRNRPEVEIIEVITYSEKDESMIFNEDQFYVRFANEADTVERFISVPEESLQHDFIIDTIDNYYRKIVIAKDPEVGTTGIYMKKSNSSRENNPMFYALMIAKTGGLTKKQQALLINVFKRVRIVNND